MKNLELHIKTIESVLKDVYDIGVTDAKEQVNEQSYDVETIVRSWIEFTNKFNVVYSDNGIRYSDGENIYTLDNMITGFKLSYGY